MNLQKLNHAFDLIEGNEFNPFGRKPPFISIGSDEDCSGSEDFELQMPDGQNVISLQFDWSYSGRYTPSDSEGGSTLINDSKEVESIKVFLFDDDGTEIVLDDKTESRIREYILNQIVWG